MHIANIFGEYIEGEEIEYPDQPYKNIIIVEDHKGDMLVTPGDYVIRGVQGELYPCKPDIFEATYEKVN